uniref:Uncharacterized protein n=1 Tax=Opuntia streptacantha TaxID=393608 RepID=A0A7C9EQH4_OPUST
MFGRVHKPSGTSPDKPLFCNSTVRKEPHWPRELGIDPFSRLLPTTTPARLLPEQRFSGSWPVNSFSNTSKSSSLEWRPNSGGRGPENLLLHIFNVFNVGIFPIFGGKTP